MSIREDWKREIGGSVYKQLFWGDISRQKGKKKRRKKCHDIYWGKAGQKAGVPKRWKLHTDGNKFIWEKIITDGWEISDDKRELMELCLWDRDMWNPM